MSGRIETLPLLEQACWQELARAATHNDHGWHVLTLATVAGRGAEAQPEARTVVLRGADVAHKLLFVYSDSRSPKVEQLRQQPLAQLVAWSRVLAWQLRIRVRAEVLTDGLDVSSRWAQVKLSRSANDYVSTQAPGTPLQRFQAERGTREHFAVLRMAVLEMDWLELHPEGHRRAAFGPAPQGARWLVP